MNPEMVKFLVKNFAITIIIVLVIFGLWGIYVYWENIKNLFRKKVIEDETDPKDFKLDTDLKVNQSEKEEISNL